MGDAAQAAATSAAQSLAQIAALVVAARAIRLQLENELARGMYFAMKRRSWPIVFPHIGAIPALMYFLRKAMHSASTAASSSVDAFTLSIKPERP